VRGSRRGTISTHKELLAQVWGADVDDIHDLRVYVKRLRAKIESDPVKPVSILTEPNLGYRFGA
jgi:two-component system KDP operon response regulator KdpE